MRLGLRVKICIQYIRYPKNIRLHVIQLINYREYLGLFLTRTQFVKFVSELNKLENEKITNSYFIGICC